MARLTNTEIEKRWYDLFCGWEKSDRAAAIKALTLAIMRKVGADGKIDLRGADLRGADLSDAIRWDEAKCVLVRTDWLTERRAIL